MDRLLTDGKVWDELGSRLKATKRPVDVAVAYFSKGSARSFPKISGSRLVVDASERAVKAGLTCPDDLLTLVNRNVHVFSANDLHAKVFVVGRTAYIGSMNVSHRSKHELVEAAIRTTQPRIVEQARRFISELPKQELTPKLIQYLATKYVPPKVGIANRNRTGSHPARHAPVRLIHLVPTDPIEELASVARRGRSTARRKMRTPESSTLDEFYWHGKLSMNLGDIVVQVYHQGDRTQSWVYPPANVVHVEPPPQRSKVMPSTIYVESPRDLRPIRLRAFKLQLGRESRKCIDRDLTLAASAAAEILNAFAQRRRLRL